MQLRESDCHDDKHLWMLPRIWMFQIWASTYAVAVSLLSTRSDVKKLLSQWRKESGRWHVANRDCTPTPEVIQAAKSPRGHKITTRDRSV